MRTPNTFQIGSTTYTTREYCNARGITDNARILKIQWRINTYIRNHTIQQTIEELDRLTLYREPKERYVATKLGKELYATDKDEAFVISRDKKDGPVTRIYHQACKQHHDPGEACQEAQTRIAQSKKLGLVTTGLISTIYDDQRKLLQQSEWMCYKESLSNEETQKPTDTTGLLITITDHLELLVGKTIKHEKFPLEGKIVGISYDIIEIDFNGKIVELELQETKGLLIVS